MSVYVESEQRGFCGILERMFLTRANLHRPNGHHPLQHRQGKRSDLTIPKMKERICILSVVQNEFGF